MPLILNSVAIELLLVDIDMELRDIHVYDLLNVFMAEAMAITA